MLVIDIIDAAYDRMESEKHKEIKEIYMNECIQAVYKYLFE